MRPAEKTIRCLKSLCIALAAALIAGVCAAPVSAIEPVAPEREEAEPQPTRQPDRVPPRTPPAPAADPCVQARADWAAIEQSPDIAVLQAFLQSAPQTCAVQRAQAQSRIAAVSRAEAPPIVTPVERAPLASQRLRDSLRAHIAPRFYAAPNIPPAILAAARRHAGNREVLAVFDLSVALNANNGLYFLEDGVLIKEMLEPARFASYADLGSWRRGPCTYACVRYGNDVINLPEFGLSDDVGRIIDAAIAASSAR